MAEQHSAKKPEKKFDKKPAVAGASVITPFAELAIFAIGALILIPLLRAFMLSPQWPEFLILLNGFLANARLIATIITMIAVLIAVYSFLRLHEIMSEETKKLGVALNWEHERTEKNHRWERVEEHMRSLNSSDWKVAILEADNILDEIVERMGYPGATLGERMKMIEQSDFPHLDDAWKAHKTRNEIAHKGGADFILTRHLAEHTINIYHRIFKELGYL